MHAHAGEQPAHGRLRGDGHKAGEDAQTASIQRTRRRDRLVLGALALGASIGSACLALQGRIAGVCCPQHWAFIHAPGDTLGASVRQRLVQSAVPSLKAMSCECTSERNTDVRMESAPGG
jgi:hypothetical protein